MSGKKKRDFDAGKTRAEKQREAARVQALIEAEARGLPKSHALDSMHNRAVLDRKMRRA